MSRNYEYEKEQTEFESRVYYGQLLENTAEAIASLSDYEYTGDPKYQHKFHDRVNKLVKLYWTKFEGESDVELPDIIIDEEVDGPRNMNEVDFIECKKVFFRIQELQREIGHTKIESLKKGNRVI